MKVFHCGGVIPGCPAVFSAEDEPGVLAAVADHASRAHGLGDLAPDTLALVRSQVRDVDASE